MTCREVDLFFDPAGGRHGEPPTALAEHLAECRRCNSIHGVLNVDRIDLAQAPRAIQRKIVRELTADLRPVSPMPDYTRLGALLLAIMFAVVLVPTGMMGGRAVKLMSAWQIASISGLLGSLAVMAAFSLACQHIPASRHLIPPRPLIAGSLLLLFAIISLVFPWRHRVGFVPTGLRCSVIGMTIALPAAALLWFVLRRGVVLNPAVTAASLGLLGGIAALTVLQLNCRIVEAGHILVWHLSVVLLMTFAGYVMGILAGRQGKPRSLRSG